MPPRLTLATSMTDILTDGSWCFTLVLSVNFDTKQALRAAIS